jgi:uncharacterized protein YqjF (DUF2071 family)
MAETKPWRVLDAVRAAERQGSTLASVKHRPWPPPDGPWLLGQTLEDLLFAHWRAPADALRALLPSGLQLDLYDGEAWVGVVPFRLTGLRARGLPPLPFASSFLGLNTRTFVTARGKPGIWFFSLDASSQVAVLGARYGFKLPYYLAEAHAERRDAWISFQARRRDSRGAPAAFRAQYRPTGRALTPEPGSLAHFLTERYRLYTVAADRRLLSADIHHPPWALQGAEAVIEENTMLPREVHFVEEDPVLHFSAQQDIVLWLTDDA